MDKQTPTQIKQEKIEDRKSEVMDIVVKKLKNNIECLFDFDNLSEKEFKNTYGATKQEIKEVI